MASNLTNQSRNVYSKKVMIKEEVWSQCQFGEILEKLIFAYEDNFSLYLIDIETFSSLHSGYCEMCLYSLSFVQVFSFRLNR